MNISTINTSTFAGGSIRTPSPDATASAPPQARSAELSNPPMEQIQQAIKQPEQLEANRKQIEEAVKAVNEFVRPLNNSLQFNIDDDTGKTVVKVVDTTTKEVLRQFPSEEMLSIAKAIDQMKGLLIQQKA